MLADSAYANSQRCVTAFKKRPLGQMPPTYKRFNTLLARPRVYTEIAYGWWKGRFPFFQEARINISGPKDMQKLIDLVDASFVVHNMLIKHARDESLYLEDPYMHMIDSYPLDHHGEFLNERMPADCMRKWYQEYFATHNWFRQVQTRVRMPART